ncbi:hypothetical protein [Mangrovibrevibacter kandeliae]|uniref:hypothetical protein n=1 Tax=Mangrovibrevibacter kandeliae TaxID=2968473 RepID=UPI00211897A2|nr:MULTISPECIES: hypothetical protein [unclassified Aurantimonas]MCQ8784014.1 hypothetical protein [Aurantimonas sp. CSK15Z-1]MCW4116731.1 hypothetical protein [Aurantimonas sp. MSK8Z-1]
MSRQPNRSISPQGLSRSIRSFAETFGSAASVAAAIESGRRPSGADLKRLGIDPTAFAGVRVF